MSLDDGVVSWRFLELEDLPEPSERNLSLMHQIANSNVGEAKVSAHSLSSGVHPLRVVAVDMDGTTAADEIQVLIGSVRPSRERAERDQDNALEAWPEHCLLGTQPGPNKNGRKVVDVLS